MKQVQNSFRKLGLTTQVSNETSNSNKQNIQKK